MHRDTDDRVNILWVPEPRWSEIKMNIWRSVVVELVGGLENNGNCEEGMYKVRGQKPD
jgi:hypothetical protein